MSSKLSVRKSFSGFKPKVAAFFKKVYAAIGNLFQPEEVEVTFKVKGKNITYTYTKVQEKQVA